MFCDTGLEYPELRDFVKTFDNVDIMYPIIWNKHKREYERCNFRQVLQKYGCPIISKDQSQRIYEIRHTKSEKLKQTRLNGNKWGMGQIHKKWLYLIDSDIQISHKCCTVMKKNPAKYYEKITGTKAFLGTQTNESRQRKSSWLTYGCNAFSATRPTSKPLSFWTEQDILTYIAKKKLPYASVYGDLIYDETTSQYKFTGLQRTGCVFCLYGIHREKCPNRIQRLADTHPKLYNYCINGGEYVDGVWQPNAQGLGLAHVCELIDVDYRPVNHNEKEN